MQFVSAKNRISLQYDVKMMSSQLIRAINIFETLHFKCIRRLPPKHSIKSAGKNVRQVKVHDVLRECQLSDKTFDTSMMESDLCFCVE